MANYYRIPLENERYLSLGISQAITDSQNEVPSCAAVKKAIGSGGGSVTSVNGQTGDVELNAADVGARADDWMPSAADVHALPDTTVIPDISGKQDTISDLAAIRAGAAAGATALQSYTETDPTVPAWAKAASKPTYTASEIGAQQAGNYATLDSHSKVTASQAESRFDGHKTANYTLTEDDRGTFITMNSSSALTVTFPDSLPIGYEVEICQWSSGAVTLSSPVSSCLFRWMKSDFSMQNTQTIQISGGYGVVALKKITGASWLAKGDIKE